MTPFHIWYLSFNDVRVTVRCGRDSGVRFRLLRCLTLPRCPFPSGASPVAGPSVPLHYRRPPLVGTHYGVRDVPFSCSILNFSLPSSRTRLLPEPLHLPVSPLSVLSPLRVSLELSYSLECDNRKRRFSLHSPEL